MVGARKSSNCRGPLCFCRRTKPQPNCQNFRDPVVKIKWGGSSGPGWKPSLAPFLSSSKCKKWHQTTILLCQLNKHKPNNLLAKNMSPANVQVQVASGCKSLLATVSFKCHVKLEAHYTKETNVCVLPSRLLNFKSHVFLVEVQFKKASLFFLDVC